jgi:hypothetical protein
LVVLAGFVYGQEAQFTFDSNGNLLTQSAENPALPLILSQPQTQVVGPGELASFFVVVADARDLVHQWRFNGTNLAGATNDALLLTNVGTTNEGLYSVVLVNSSGSITSAPAALMLDSRGCGMPDSWQLTYFGNLTNTATGDYDHDGISNLQEFLDGTNPTNSASARFRLTVLNDGGSVAVGPSQASFTNGQNVTLTASPPEAFHDWTGDALSQSSTVTLTMTTNKTVFARFTPVNFFWNNPAGGDWNVATNWSPNLVPGPNDNAFIAITATVTVNTNTDCGGLMLGSPGAAPTLTGSGTLTLHGASFWTNGTVSGSGRTIVAPEGVVTIANPSTMFLTARALDNGGTIFWTGSLLAIGNGVVITNRPGALFDAQNAAQFGYQSGAVCGFDNAGTFRKELNPGTTTFSGGVLFNNYGTVDLQSGTLLCNDLFVNGGGVTLSPGATNRLAAGGSTSGSFTASATALVECAGGTFTLNSGAQLNGNGLYRITTGTFVDNADVSLQNLDLAATLSGPGIVTVSNVMNWTAGSMSGSGRTLIAPGATLNVNCIGSVSLTGRTLENGGSILWTNTGLIVEGSGAVITNRAGAVFDAKNASGVLYGSGGFCSVDNAGTFRKSSSTGTTTFSSGITLNSYGTVDLQTGTVVCNGSFLNNGVLSLGPGTTCRLTAGGSASGAFTAPPTALVEWTAGTFTLNSGAQLNDAGRYRINGATLTCNPDVVVQNLDVLAGTFGGNSTVTVSNVMNWTGGTMSGAGRTTIPAGATLNISSPSGVFLANRSLEIGGTALWTNAGGITMTAAVITNRAGALFQAQNASYLTPSFASSASFDNAGIFRKSVSTGTTTFDSRVAFNNYGLVDLRSGILAANGGYSSSSNALLNCAIGGTTAGTGYGQLQVAGTVTLNGSFSVNLTNGFTPAANDSFTVLTVGTRNGTFVNFYYPSNEVTMVLSNTANSVIVRATELLATSQPVLLTPELSGTDIRLIWTAISNTTYRLEYETGPSFTNWIGLPGEITSLSNTASKLDTLTSSNRFYRVRVIP